ncbi:hypothetical protein DL769_005103 [Monosporascus sp. CRB-8-3]|nr:hypothetical protein DL769_005103 [Monosporascus sp. CRB-8-3]
MSLLEAVNDLKQAIPGGEFHERGTDLYTKLNSHFLSALESDLQPAWIFRPGTKEDVATFIKTIKPYSHRVKFAIYGAGQQPLPGCANIQDHITLNLSRLTGIEIKDDAVRIGAGEHWGAVYDKLDNEGLGVTGSRSAAGGGLSFFSSREGFIVDNVVNYEVVLASGEVVNANAQENSDLWIALKGAGNNLGVITRYDFRTFKQGPMWGGNVFYFHASFPGQIEALVAELTKPDASRETHLMISMGYSAMINPDALMCLNQPYFTQATKELPPEIEPFANVQPQIDAMSTMCIKSLKEAAAEQAAASQSQVRCAYMNITVKADVATLQAAADIYAAGLGPVRGAEAATFSFTLQPYPLSLLEKSAASGGNSLGLKPSLGPLVSVLLLSYWRNKNDDAAVLAMMKQSLAKMKQDASSRNTLVPFEYMNYAFLQQDPIGSYGPENKARLQEASKKYDPEGLFQKGCPGGFKLFT